MYLKIRKLKSLIMLAALSVTAGMFAFNGFAACPVYPASQTVGKGTQIIVAQNNLEQLYAQLEKACQKSYGCSSSQLSQCIKPSSCTKAGCPTGNNCSTPVNELRSKIAKAEREVKAINITCNRK